MNTVTQNGQTASRMAGNPRGSGYRRADLDFYVEPQSCTHALLNVEPFKGEVWDPACGIGNIVQVCRDSGLIAWGSDIADRGFGSVDDFLAVRSRPVDNVICNPPFKLSLAFAQKAVGLARRKVAFLQRLCWLEGQERSAFIESSPLTRVHVFRNRVCMPPGEKRDLPQKGGFIAYAWFIWLKGHRGPPTIHWISTNNAACPVAPEPRAPP